MAELDARLVKRGLWTNLDQGPIMGKTITTDATTGTLIVALLAIVSTLGTGHLWHLVTFTLHQLRATGTPSTAHFRQQQALLRTSPTPGTVILDIFKLWWTWKRSARPSFWRSLSIILLAVLFSASTIAASIFSSLVVDSSNLVVLVQSKNCQWNDNPDPLQGVVPGPIFQVAKPYAEKCYGGANASLPLACNIFVQTSILSNKTRAPCPFAEGWCEGGYAVSLDSGLVDVGRAFGLNIPAGSGVKMRKKTTCAVLPAQNFTDVVKAQDVPGTVSLGRKAVPGEEVAVLDYGARNGTLGNASQPADPGDEVTVHVLKRAGETGNATFWTSLMLANVTNTIDLLPGIVHYNSPTPLMPSGFTPIPSLAHNDSTLVLKILNFNSATFLFPSKDALYSANRETNISVVSNGKAEDEIHYLSDTPLKGIGCLEQYQFCYREPSGKDFCTPLTSIPANTSTSYFPTPNPIQHLLLTALTRSVSVFSLLNAEGLVMDTLYRQTDGDLKGLIVSPRPDDWINEVVAWQKQVWASLQVFLADFATGELARPVQFTDTKKVVSKEVKTLCGAQKMRKSGGIVNINVFGLAFILSFSLFVTILDITLLKFLVFLSRFRRTLAPRIDRWVQDGVWQLQRRAYEGQGFRGWMHVEKEIPITTEERLLGDLPILWTPEKVVTGSGSGNGSGGRGSVAGSWRSGTSRGGRNSGGSARGYGRSPEISGWI